MQHILLVLLTKIEKLVSNGFTYNTLRGLNESQIGLLYSRLVEQPSNAGLEKTSQGLDALNQKLTDVEYRMKNPICIAFK